MASGPERLQETLRELGIDTEVVRLSDSTRTAPEAAAGGPLALVRSGDTITLDVPNRSLHLHVDDGELARRRSQWSPPPPHSDRGWVKLYCDHVLQADQGVDLDFLVGSSGAPVGRESH